MNGIQMMQWYNNAVQQEKMKMDVKRWIYDREKWCYNLVIMEWIETTMKCDEKWKELTRKKIKNSKLKLAD